MTDRPTVLFLCTHNSARSQMAEGLLRAMGGDRFEVHSAGTEATGVRPEAIMVMREIGIDISGQASKTLERYLHADLAWLVTVCDQAREACPTLPGVRNQLHWSVEDPAAVNRREANRRLPRLRATSSGRGSADSSKRRGGSLPRADRPASA